MASMNGELSSASESTSWEDFCDSRAETASENFVKDFLDFRRVNGNCQVNDPVQYARKFVDYFLKYFDEKLKRSSYYQESNQTVPKLSLSSVPHRLAPQISLHDDYDDDPQIVPQVNLSRNGETSKSVKSPHHRKGGLLRKFSLRGIRKKGKHQVEDVNNDQPTQDTKKHKHINPLKHEKVHKQSKLLEVNENCVKEGIVHVLTGEDAKGKSRWEKTRLVLLTKDGGSSLEFYSPPKSVKPKAGLFCFLITQARVTTSLEMPDHEYTFVLKGQGTSEFVIEAQTMNEVHSWLEVLSTRINTSLDVPEDDLEPTPSMRPRLATAPSGRTESPSPGIIQSSTSQRSLTSNPPDVPPRPSPRSLPRTEHISTSLRHIGDHLDSHNRDSSGDIQIEQTLREYPWFHENLTRSEAAQLVLQQGPTGHGVFLVRPSETRKGESVLTFNFQGKAKHLRMTLNNDGQCRVQHLWFQSIFDMLEHFRTHPIPLESGGTSDVTLTDYVVAIERPVTPNLPRGSPRSRGGGHHGSNPNLGNNSLGAMGGSQENRDIVVVHGSVRARTESIENVMREQGQHGRAIENQYSFV
ncbi:SH2B adapter protein 2-like [Mytilus trossulus]|uniref:SH2B adapter protein 2-like n=1 Tax=Mytilus trossulus TaxID=6551 RepID=UPI0030062C57